MPHEMERPVLEALGQECWQVAEDKGWHPPEGNPFLSQICLVHAELSEASEEWRNGSPPFYYGPNNKPEGMAVELADAVIRIFEISRSLGYDLPTAIRTKIEYNKTRPFRHGGKRA